MKKQLSDRVIRAMFWGLWVFVGFVLIMTIHYILYVRPDFKKILCDFF